MVAVETLILTGGIVVADLIALHEYLRLENELARVKVASAASVSPTLNDFAQEVNEPIASGDSTESFGTLETTAETRSESTSSEVTVTSTSGVNEHFTALGEISAKLDSVLNSASKVRQRVTG